MANWKLVQLTFGGVRGGWTAVWVERYTRVTHERAVHKKYHLVMGSPSFFCFDFFVFHFDLHRCCFFGLLLFFPSDQYHFAV